MLLKALIDFFQQRNEYLRKYKIPFSESSALRSAHRDEAYTFFIRRSFAREVCPVRFCPRPHDSVEARFGGGGSNRTRSKASEGKGYRQGGRRKLRKCCGGLVLPKGRTTLGPDGQTIYAARLKSRHLVFQGKSVDFVPTISATTRKDGTQLLAVAATYNNRSFDVSEKTQFNLTVR